MTKHGIFKNLLIFLPGLVLKAVCFKNVLYFVKKPRPNSENLEFYF